MFTYKVVPIGDGSLYGWAKFDGKGVRLEESVQHWPSAADAEKSLRAFVSSNDKIEVERLSNINPPANKNVNIVVPPQDEEDKYHGMTPVNESIEDKGDKATGQEMPNPKKKK